MTTLARLRETLGDNRWGDLVLGPRCSLLTYVLSVTIRSRTGASKRLSPHARDYWEQITAK